MKAVIDFFIGLKNAFVTGWNSYDETKSIGENLKSSFKDGYVKGYNDAMKDTPYNH